MTQDSNPRKPRNRSRRTRGGTLQQPPFRAVHNPFKPLEIASEDQIEALHHASLDVLRDIGMKITDRRALVLLHGPGPMLISTARLSASIPP